MYLLVAGVAGSCLFVVVECGNLFVVGCGSLSVVVWWYLDVLVEVDVVPGATRELLKGPWVVPQSVVVWKEVLLQGLRIAHLVVLVVVEVHWRDPGWA